MKNQTIKTLKNIFILLSTTALVFWVFRQIYLKIQYEKNNKNVEICVDFEQILNLCNKENYDLKNFLERIKIIGVSSIVLPEENFTSICQDKNIVYFSEEDVKKYELIGLMYSATAISPEIIIVKNKNLAEYIKGIIEFKTGLTQKIIKSGSYSIIKISEGLKQIGWGYHPDKIELIKKHGFGLILKPYKQFWVPEDLSENFSLLILTGEFDKEIVPRLKDKNIKVAVQEFSEEEGKYKKYLVPVSENIFRMHRIDFEMSPEYAFYRWIRAVKERNCRVLYYDFYEDKTIEENLNHLRNITSKLKEKKFKLSQVQSQKKVSNLFGRYSKIFALFFSILIPVISVVLYKNFLYNKNFIIVFFVISFINLLGSFLISAFLSSTEYFLKLNEFRGIRFALISPLFFAVPVLFSIEEIKEFLSRPVNFRGIILGIILFLFLFIVAVRTENVTQIPKTESWARLFLEKIFGIRPRFKEFLIGHPLLLLGLAFNSRMFVLFGLLGQTSLINTFLHLHTPFYICFFRTLYGLITGFIIGLVVIEVYKNYGNKIKSLAKLSLLMK